MARSFKTPLAKRRRPCIRCGKRVTIGPVVLGSPIVGTNGNIGRKGPGGAIFTFKGAYYCAACAPGVLQCRVCGCTKEAACRVEHGPYILKFCHMVDLDLCSVCQGKQSPRKEAIHAAT